MDSIPLVDGIYPSMHRGGTSIFSLVARLLAPVSSLEIALPFAAHIERDVYDLQAAIYYHEANALVLDFGILALASLIDNGDVIIGGNALAGMAKLMVSATGLSHVTTNRGRRIPVAYAWNIERIQILTAPRIVTKHPSGQAVLIPNEQRLVYHDVESTDIVCSLDEWPYSDPMASILLTCSPLGIAAG
jgi:hypothetical protein